MDFLKINPAWKFILQKFLNGHYFFLAGIAIFGAFLRFKNLTSESLWLDELHTVEYISGGIKKIIKLCMSSDEMPFHHVLIWIWTKFFGLSDYSLRAFSAFMGVIGILAIYYLGKKIFSKQAGLVAALFLTAARFHIVYSREARPYSLLFLLVILSYLSLVKQIEKPCLKNSILYILSTTLCIYTHYYGLLILFSQVIFILLSQVNVKKNLRFLKYMAVSFLCVGFLYTPWVGVLIRGVEQGTHYAKSLKPDFFKDYFNDQFGNEPFLTVVFSVLFLIYLFMQSKEAKFIHHKILILTWIFFPLFLPYLWSFNHQTPLVFRYSIGILPSLFLMGSSAVGFIKENAARVFLIAVIFSMSLVNIFFTHGNFYSTRYKGQWREAARYTIENSPIQKYWIYGHKDFEYYFNHVYKQNVEVHKAIFYDPFATNNLYGKIKIGQKSGVWILEVHDMFDGYLHEFFSPRLIKTEEVKLFNAQATLYISPKDFQVSLKRIKIPLDWVSLEGDITTRDLESIIVGGDFQLFTPELIFEKGKYELRILTEGTVGQELQISLPSGDSKQSLLLEENKREYKIRFDCPVPAKAGIVIKSNFNNSSFQKNTIVSGIQIQRIETLGDFLRSLTNNINDIQIILSVKDDAEHSLNASSLLRLKGMGFKKIGQLKFRESYVAVLDKGKIVFEEKGSKTITYKKGEMTLKSGGLDFGNTSDIVLDKIDYSKNTRGLNIVVVRGKSISSYYCDTNADKENLVQK